MNAVVWDPFTGTVPFERSAVALPDDGMRFPGWLTSVLGLICVASSLGVVMAIFWRPVAWFAIGGFVISFAGLMAISLLARASEKRDFMFYRLAEENGWAFRLIKPDVKGRINGRNYRDRDPYAQRAYERIPELCRSRPGQLIPLRLQGMFWGTTASGTPFWLGLQEYEVDASLAATPLRRDQVGGRGSRGRLYNMVASYDLDRDTGIKASLLAEVLDRDGWHDIKTESVEFNRRFKIAIAQDRQGTGGHAELLRALTPATQSVLIDLHERYQVQLVIDGRTIFVSGCGRVMSEDADLVARHFSTLVEDFAQAAFSFKHYAE